MPPIRTSKKQIPDETRNACLTSFGFKKIPKFPKEEVVPPACLPVSPTQSPKYHRFPVEPMQSKGYCPDSTRIIYRIKPDLPPAKPETLLSGAPDPTAAPQPQVLPPSPLSSPPEPKKRLPKPVQQGQKLAYFSDSRTDWDGKYHELIGYTTQTIQFQYHFKLTE
jgi:hypothetical protein